MRLHLILFCQWLAVSYAWAEPRLETFDLDWGCSVEIPAAAPATHLLLLRGESYLVRPPEALPKHLRPHMRALLFRTRELEPTWSKIKSSLPTDGAEDLLILDREGEIDYLEGVIRSVNSDTIGFEKDGEVIQARVAKLKALWFYLRPSAVAEMQQVETQALLVLRDGSTLKMASFEEAKDRIKGRSVEGLSVCALRSEVDKLDLDAPKQRWLRDLTIEKVEFVSRLSALNSDQDSSFVKYVLRRQDADTMTVQAGTKVHFDLRQMQPFVPNVFLLSAGNSNPAGKLHMRLYVDGQMVHDQEVSGDQPSTDLAFKWEKPSRLTIEVVPALSDAPAGRLVLTGARFKRF